MWRFENSPQHPAIYAHSKVTTRVLGTVMRGGIRHDGAAFHANREHNVDKFKFANVCLNRADLLTYY